MENRQNEAFYYRAHHIYREYMHLNTYIVIVYLINTSYQLIKLNCVQMEKIPDHIPKFDTIIELYIQRCSILIFPEWFDQLQNLEILCVRDCGIKILPETIGKLKNLKYLNIEGNLLYQFPDFIYKLTSLEYLITHFEDERFLTKKMLNLKNLKQLIIPYYVEYDLDEIKEYFLKKGEMGK